MVRSSTSTPHLPPTSTSTPSSRSSRSSVTTTSATTRPAANAFTASSNSPRRAQSSLGVSDALRRTSTASTASSRASSRPPFPAVADKTKTAASPIIAATKQASASRRAASLDPRTLPTQPLPAASASFAASRNALRSRDRNAALSSRPPLHHPTITLRRSPSTTSLTSSISSLSVHSPRTPSVLSPMRPLKAPPSAMGYEKDNTPRKPTLASRPYARAPLTPKIASTTSGITPSLAASGARTPTAAGPGSQSTSPYQTVTVTPLARRSTGLSSTGTSTAAQNYHNDVASPVPPYLNNITPRSGSRQSRVDSTTPTGTPTHTGLGIAGSADPDSKFFYASDAKPAIAAPPLGSSVPGVSSSASTPALAASPSLGPPSRASAFFYANGKSLPGTNGGSSSAGSAPTPPLASPIHIAPTASQPTDHLASKFVHANGDAIDRKLSVSSQQPKLASSPALVQTSSQSQAQAQAQSRPMSPVKLASYPLQRSDSTRSAVLPAPAPLIAATIASPPLGPTSPGNNQSHLLSRSRSTFSASIGSNSSSNSGHSRKGSLTVADPPMVARLIQSSQPSSETSSPASSQYPSSFPFPAVNAGNAPATAGTATSGLASLLQAAEDFGDESNDDDDDAASNHDKSGVDDKTSNVNSSAGTDDSAKDDDNPLNDLVKIARRERKVQDLEITNASLEAINRSLERQLRKQKAEIRQFRRLSRAGRLSSAPNAGGPAGSKLSVVQTPISTSRITSSSTVEGPLQDTDRILAMGDDDDDTGDKDDNEYPSDMETSFNEEDEDDYDDDEDDDSDENLLSAKNSTRRKRDERRMQLDLAKHRQLLVDSQKINQSIKRCMNWTEELISEGKKALAFQVRVSEVQLGGRVLAEDEVEERRQKREEREKLGLGATLPVDHDTNSMLGDGGSTLGVSDMGSVMGSVMGDSGSTLGVDDMSGAASTAADDTLRLDDFLHKDMDGDDFDVAVEEVSADDASTFSAVDVDMDTVGKSKNRRSNSSSHTDGDPGHAPQTQETPSFALQQPLDDVSDTHDESFSPVTHSRTVRFDDDDVPPADGLPLGSASTTPKPAQGPFPSPVAA
ncbi:hypothetical protein F503_04114 [Ophiostoma piceae UAMH 11346]|uniref:Uncharacterized protein n=1 Tax=Ophiostoma piceae (strain UAMH 11346) TaxID=1262450 RepID=S3C6U1_OPHP1|nr:hypothetical protein F503_04114 [Ophiostoma piceae UAMH 11346]